MVDDAFAGGSVSESCELASEALVQLDWKYIYWPDFNVEQLFDLTADPFEENDLVAQPAQPGRLTQMRARFQTLKQAAK